MIIDRLCEVRFSKYKMSRKSTNNKQIRYFINIINNVLQLINLRYCYLINSKQFIYYYLIKYNLTVQTALFWCLFGHTLLTGEEVSQRPLLIRYLNLLKGLRITRIKKKEHVCL